MLIHPARRQVTNLHDTISLAEANLVWKWSLATNGVPWAEGRVASVDAAPQQTARIQLELPSPPKGSPSPARTPEIWLTVSCEQLAATPGTPAGFELGWEQFCLPELMAGVSAPAASAPPAGAVRALEQEEVVTVRGEGGEVPFELTISKKDGALTSFVYSGEHRLMLIHLSRLGHWRWRRMVAQQSHLVVAGQVSKSLPTHRRTMTAGCAVAHMATSFRGSGGPRSTMTLAVELNRSQPGGNNTGCIP